MSRHTIAAAAAEDAARLEAETEVAPASDGYSLVPARTLLEPRPVAWFALAPGDRILVAPGDLVGPGTVLAERQRDPRLEDGPPSSGATGTGQPLRPGDWWSGDGHEAAGPLRRRLPRTAAGELLHPAGSRWRMATGDHVDMVETPARGTVRTVTPGRGIEVELAGRGLVGAFAAGLPTSGRLERIAGEAGLRGALDVGRAGAILVVEGRIDSEGIIRARAMGVRGVVVGGLAGKDLRDLLGSEARQRASLQPLAPFAVLVLDGAIRRPLARPMAALAAALDGQQVALLVDPPMLVFDPPESVWPGLPPGWVRIRGGGLAGVEGRWLRGLGLRQFAAGVHLEAAAVALEDGEVAIVPIADLERFT